MEVPGREVRGALLASPAAVLSGTLAVQLLGKAVLAGSGRIRDE